MTYPKRVLKSVWCRIWYGRSYAEEQEAIEAARKRSENLDSNGEDDA